MNGMEYTNDMDIWLSERKAKDHDISMKNLTEEFNVVFGTDKSEDALAKHCSDCGIKSRYYTEEQRKWIKEHFYVEGHDLVRLFNERFGCCRGYTSIRNQRNRLDAHRNRRRRP